VSVALIAGIVVIVLIAAIALSQRSGPRITTIETTTEVEEEDVKDRRDA
jgi:hypothetical protein